MYVTSVSSVDKLPAMVQSATRWATKRLLLLRVLHVVVVVLLLLLLSVLGVASVLFAHDVAGAWICSQRPSEQQHVRLRLMNLIVRPATKHTPCTVGKPMWAVESRAGERRAVSVTSVCVCGGCYHPRD